MNLIDHFPLLFTTLLIYSMNSENRNSLLHHVNHAFIQQYILTVHKVLSTVLGTRNKMTCKKFRETLLPFVSLLLKGLKQNK